MEEEEKTQKQIAQRYRDRVAAKYARSGWRRALFWVSLLAIVGGVVAIYFAQGRTSPEFFNTGPLSLHHRPLVNDCATCHRPEALAKGGFLEVVNDRFRRGAPSFARIDQVCMTCHQQHDFHQPNVVGNQSCSACHMEHNGPGPMPAVSAVDCAACHNDRDLMQASAELGKKTPPWRFRLNPSVVTPTGGRPNVLRLPRPPEGYTQVFPTFGEQHPPFQLHRENVRETEVLRFNHQRHLSGADIPMTKDGRKLDCASCHQAAPNGRYMERVNFEAHCQSCHSLQFDVRNPGFQLPHGDAQLVRTFLRTLPAQYGEFARREKKMTNERQIAEFTGQQVRQLLAQFGSAEEIERAVFFTKDPYRAAQQSDAATRANYAGCAYCHTVQAGAGGAYPMPTIVAPVIIDRWMPHAFFSHARHTGLISCQECHATAANSRLTADVLMPTKESCTSCHSPAALPVKRASVECSTCHMYHAPDPREPSPGVGTAVSFKEMLLQRDVPTR
ncbi:MAG: cytochrome c3 family protein [Chthoniobacterales bacterium]